MGIGTRSSPWAPRIMLAVAAVVSLLVLAWGLKKTTASYDAVETRGIEIRRLPSASEQLDVGSEDQVSSLDLLPKVSLREADPLPPEPSAPPEPPVQQAVYTPAYAPPAEPEKPQRKEFRRPALQPRGLPKGRSSNASTGAFLQNAPEAAQKSAPAASSPSGGGTPAPDRPRVFRDTTGKAALRN